MSRTKAIFGALVVVLAVGALVASSASASWVVGGTTLSGSAKLANTAAVMENGKLKFSETTVECTGSVLDGTGAQIESPDKGSATSLTFLGCSTTAGSTCKITGQPVSIGTVPITATVVLGTGNADTATFSPKTKNTFATIKFEGSGCATSGVQPVKGKAKVTAPTGQTESVLQEIVAATGAGELEVGSAEATLLGKALLQLESKQAWKFV